MPLREFNDSDDKAWTVWSTMPQEIDATNSRALRRFMASLPDRGGMHGVGVREAYSAGWLTFRAGSDMRRLAPIPDRWESASDDLLSRYLGQATQIAPVARKHGTGPALPID